MPTCLSLSVYLYRCLFPFLSLSYHLSLSLSVILSVSVFLFICLSVCLSIQHCLSVRLCLRHFLYNTLSLCFSCVCVSPHLGWLNAFTAVTKVNADTHSNFITHPPRVCTHTAFFFLSFCMIAAEMGSNC